MNNDSVKEKDYQIGCQAEDRIFKVLSHKNFKVTATNRWKWNDFEIINKTSCKKYKLELKHRIGIRKNMFDTTIMPFSKIVEWRKVKKEYDDFILMFEFIDGTYYIPYSFVKKLATTDKRIQVKEFHRTKGCDHKSRLHLYVPVEYLIPLKQLEVNT